MPTSAVKFVTLLKTDQKEKGRYPLSFEIVPHKKAESTVKKRKNEGYLEDSCVHSPISSIVELPLKDGKCSIKFELAGALKPELPLALGENNIVYNEKGQAESRRELLTVPSYDGQTNGSSAAVTFTVNGEFQYKVTITDIPPRPLLSTSSSSSFVSVSGPSRQESVFSQFSSLSVEDDSIDEVQSSNVSCTGGSTSYEGGAKALAQPVYPGQDPNNIPPGPPAPRPIFSLQNEAGSDGADGGAATGSTSQVQYGSSSIEEATDSSEYGHLLTNGSLKTLVMAIGPNDFSQLIIFLGVSNSAYAICKKNHPHDIVSANYDALLGWKQNGTKNTVADCNDWQKALVEKLLVALQQIRRNDIRRVIMQVIEMGPRPLTTDDFPNV